MHFLIGFLAYNLCFVVAGFGLFAGLGRKPMLGDLAFAFIAGMALVLVVVSVIAAFGYVCGIPAFLAVTAVPASVLAIRWRQQHWKIRDSVSSPSLRRIPISVVAASGLMVAIVWYVFALLRFASVEPIFEWDAWSMWTLKAKALVMLGNLQIADYANLAHIDYPILVPMLQAFFFRFTGGFDTQLLHLEYALIPLAFIGTVWRWVGRTLGTATAAAWALYVLMLPGLENNVPDALGDVPVAVFTALAAFAIAAWLRDGDTRFWLPVFFVFGAAAIWSKNEGLSAIILIGLCGLLLSIHRPLRGAAVPMLVALLAVLAAYLPWYEWKKARDIAGDRNLSELLHPIRLLDNHARAVQSFNDLWGQLSTLNVWLWLPYLSLALVVAAFVARRGRRIAVFAALVPGSLFFFYIAVYAISTDPLGLDWLLATSSTRVVASVGLISVALLPLQIISILDIPVHRGGGDGVGAPH